MVDINRQSVVQLYSRAVGGRSSVVASFAAIVLSVGVILGSLSSAQASAAWAPGDPASALKPPEISRPPSLLAQVTPSRPNVAGGLLAAEEQLRARRAWRDALVKTRHLKKGCYTSSFPEGTWREIPCKAAPGFPQRPGHGGSPEAVGGGGMTDFSAQDSSGFISSATGSFASISDGVVERGQINGSGPQVDNAYSLQLNTNYFTTPACANAGAGAMCRGWEQFVYASDGRAGSVFIQYWLLSFNAVCPTDWSPSPGVNSGDIDCYKNDDSGGTPVPVEPVSSLNKISLVGSVGASDDSVILLVGDTAYLTTGDNSLSAVNGWKAAEFNIFGDAGLGQAVFGPDTTIVVRTAVNNSGATAPGCVQTSFTGETNNLRLSGTPSSATSASPFITFTETNSSGAAPAGCATANGDGSSQQIVSGENYVDFGNDQTGLRLYTTNGALCVVHYPNCPTDALAGIGGVGHNGRDHFFPNDASLPGGVVVEGVMYTPYWPPGMDHTDRGGLGSKGSYGTNADRGIQSTAPLYSVEWQNACQASTGADWSALPVTYQVSFLISVPKGVFVKGAVSPDSPSGEVCHVADRPRAPASSTPVPVNSIYIAYLRSSAPSNGGYLAWSTTFPPVGAFATSTPLGTWAVQSISNVNNFDIFLLSNNSMSDECFQTGHGHLIKSKSQLTDIAALFGSNHPPLNLVACTTGNVPSQVGLSIDYVH